MNYRDLEKIKLIKNMGGREKNLLGSSAGMKGTTEFKNSIVNLFIWRLAPFKSI